jgi:hypothetical protein
MVMNQKIQDYIQKLPPSFQEEVLDFLEYLLAKAERETARREEKEWSRLSFESAIRVMEDEPDLYTISDLTCT